MAIDPVSAARAYQQAANATANVGGATGGDSVDFGGLVQDAIRQAGQSANVAETQALAVAAGQGDIVDVVTAIAAAETQLQTVIAVRDQVISAYQEILRMPI
ncbi:MAG TPA: flagellar hook-basal body complex protein FliE [Vitreimonas sp.]|uniref:flagellar hook-basal body complex protein FliE n=1 Tax=Vitreimonas sp. TaxID=3069702 RepID=UPI002D737899|nr:flagellar hook-basal body complex protein FliE [Vitreimonas sp.]HYD89092.1 flagellar hook-basal body complex protein FliE [Vitreimonas sp.]